jgi:hypothetical protein
MERGIASRKLKANPKQERQWSGWQSEHAVLSARETTKSNLGQEKHNDAVKYVPAELNQDWRQSNS